MKNRIINKKKKKLFTKESHFVDEKNKCIREN